MSDFRRLLGYLRPYSARLAVAIAASGLVALFTLALTALVTPLVDRDLSVLPPALRPRGSGLGGLIGGDVPAYVLIVLAFLGKGAFAYLSQYLISWVGERAVYDLRADVGRALAHQSVGYYADRPTGAFISRVTSDAERVLQMLSEKLYDVLVAVPSMAALAAYVVWRDWRIATAALVLAPLVVLPVAGFRRRLKTAAERSQERLGELASRVHEVVRGIRVVKAHSTEDLESDRIARAARAVFASNMRSARVVALTPPLMECIAGVSLALAFFYGRSRITSGAMTQGEFTSVLVALFTLYTPIKKLSRVHAAYEVAMAASRRCFSVIDAPCEVVERPGARELGEVKGEVRLERVSFRYGERWVLRRLDFLLPAGSVAAVVGRSGAGKTTLANLILRFHDPSEGRITIDGTDLREVTVRSLRHRIGLVAQDVVLFNDTVHGNIAYGLTGVSAERVEAAARAAFAHDFIVALPRGYDTLVGEAGLKLSTGQRQRLAIARALLRDPPLLILDEATSALDAESESLVVKALANLMAGRTTLVIAHRLATVRRADLIVVLEEGGIREWGTHDELVRREGGLYNRLAELQAIGEIHD